MDEAKKPLGSISDEPVNVNDKYRSVSEELEKEKLRKLKLENDAIEGSNIGDSQDRGQRKDFAERVYYFACVYMVFVFLILFLSGSTGANFKLNDSVLITLLRTTTANVIGVFAIVVTYLFSRKKK